MFLETFLNVEKPPLIGLPRPKARFHSATLFARRKAQTRIRHRDWLKLTGEKIRREQVGTVPTFLYVRANKFDKWKTGLSTNEGNKRKLEEGHRGKNLPFC